MKPVKPPGIAWKEVVRRTFTNAMDDDILGRSAQLSYYFFLALFPALICMLALLKSFAGTGETVRVGFLHFMTNVLPGSASELVQKTLNEITAKSAKSKIPIGIIFSIWSASAGMSAVMDTLNGVLGVREGRSFIRRNLTAIGLTVACALLLIVALVIVLAGDWTADTFLYGILAIFFKVVQWPVAVVLILFGFALIYFFASDVKDQKWHWVTPGAVCGLCLWLTASLTLKAYVYFFNTYNATYGSLGAVIILLLWFYLTGAAVLLGAEINSVLEDEAAKEGDPEAKMRGEKAPGQVDRAVPNASSLRIRIAEISKRALQTTRATTKQTDNT
jgi:membrane protein